jgi:hypothetical protein
LIGQYHIKVLSLPRIQQDNLKIDQSTTTKVQIQQPGKLNLICRKAVVVSIFRHEGGKLVLVKNVEMNGFQSITILQPGNYTIIYREAHQKETIKTKERSFVISSGQVTQIEIY